LGLITFFATANFLVFFCLVILSLAGEDVCEFWDELFPSYSLRKYWSRGSLERPWKKTISTLWQRVWWIRNMDVLFIDTSVIGHLSWVATNHPEWCYFCSSILLSGYLISIISNLIVDRFFQPFSLS
jgi:hypothetical protein